MAVYRWCCLIEKKAETGGYFDPSTKDYRFAEARKYMREKGLIVKYDTEKAMYSVVKEEETK